MPFSRANRHLTLSFALIVAALFVIGVGAQAYVAQRDNETRDREDREYADCLTRFAADLVDTIRARTDASARLERASERKDRALDRLIVLSNRAQASGAQSEAELPPGLLDEYQRVLRERVAAQRAYDQLARVVKATREDNPYVSPRVKCRR